MVALKLGVVLFVIVAGFGYIDPANWHPFFHHEKASAARFQGAAYVFFAYIGFDSISTHAEEARNPQRDVPIGILVSLGLCTVLYIPVAAVLTGMVPYAADRHRRADRPGLRALRPAGRDASSSRSAPSPASRACCW